MIRLDPDLKFRRLNKVDEKLGIQLFENRLPLVDAFRTFLLVSTPEMRVIFCKIHQKLPQFCCIQL